MLPVQTSIACVGVVLHDVQSVPMVWCRVVLCRVMGVWDTHCISGHLKCICVHYDCCLCNNETLSVWEREQQQKNKPNGNIHNFVNAFFIIREVVAL